MSLKRISKNARLSAAIAMSLFSASVSTVYALPTGEHLQSGEATVTRDGSNMDVNQVSERVSIDWNTFDIASGETVNFKQPGADSIALNRVTGNDVSQIYGALNANGKVFLINPNGVLFGRGAQVDVGGLVASTANVNDTFMKEFGGSTGNFNLSIDDTNKAAIINQATINAINDRIKDEGGLVVLHAANVENSAIVKDDKNVETGGKITVGKGGTVRLVAGKTLNINYDSAKINFIVDGGLSEANVLNAGTISAQNGVIAMTARGANDVLSSVVNQTGAKLEAKGLTKNEKGEIILEAGTDGKAFGEGKGLVAISGTVDVSGKNGADGGDIKITAENVYVEGNGSYTDTVDGKNVSKEYWDGAELNASGKNGGNINIKTVNMIVENNNKIHAEATDKDGENGTWTVETPSNVSSYWVSTNKLKEIKDALATEKTKADEMLKDAQTKYAEAEQAKKDRDAAQAKVNELTKEIEAATTDNQKKQEALKTAETNLENANEALEKAKDKQSEAQTKLDNAQAALEKAAKEQSEANTGSYSANKDAQVKAGVYKQAQEAVKTAQKELETANGNLTAAADAQSKAQTAYNNAQSAAETAAQNLNTANSEKDTVQAYCNLAESIYNTKEQEAKTAQQNADNAQTAYKTVCELVGKLDEYHDDADGIWYVNPGDWGKFAKKFGQLEAYAPQNLSEGYKKYYEEVNGWTGFWQGFFSWFGLDHAAQHNAAKNTRSMFEAARDFEAGVSAAAQQAASDAETTKNNLKLSLEQADSKVKEMQTAKKNADDEVTRTAGELNTANTNKTNAEAAVGEANTKLGTANAAADKAKGEAESAQKHANEAAGKLTATNEAVNKAQEGVNTAQTAKNNADAEVNNANTAQQGAQKAYNDADSALKASDNELKGLGEKKAAQEGLVKSNDEKQAADSKANKESLKSGMDNQVDANKAFAEAVYEMTKGSNGVIIGTNALNNALVNTNVTIKAHNETQHASDVVISGDITKNKGGAVTLNLEADRNVSLKGLIRSEKELNITTKAGSSIELKQGNREGELYGANLIYNTIETTGDINLGGNTYVGRYLRDGQKETAGGTISAKNVTFGRDVVLATGETVNVTATENVTFNGAVNSGNAYAYRVITDEEQKALQDKYESPNYWDYAREKAKNSELGESYLATITDGIEDSAAAGVRPGPWGESYVGGKAGEWVENENGTKSREWTWADGPEEGQSFFTQTQEVADKYKGGAYDSRLVTGEATNGYSNFLPGEPSNTNNKQDVLAIGYTDSSSDVRENRTQRWDDAFSTGNNEGKYYATSYIQEINVGESSLSINAGKNIELNGQLGDKRSLNGIELKAETAHLGGAITAKGDLNIDATLTGKTISLTSTDGSINLTQSVTAGTPKAEDVVTPQRRLLRLRGGDSSEGDVVLEAAGDVNVADVNAQGKISVESGNNTTLNGVLKSGSDAIGAVQVSAGEAFINNAGENAIQTAEKGTWQIYSATPENDVFGGLNSNNTAIWNAKGTVDNGGKNTYSFKYQPTLTVKANDATKTYGDVSEGNGVTVTNSLAGMENAEEFKNAFTDTTNAAELLAGYTLTSDGFAKTATRRNGDYTNEDGKVVSENLVAWGKTYTDKAHQVKPYYDINVEGAENNTGYNVVTEKGKLTVNKANLTINVGHVEADYGTSYDDISELFTADAYGFKNDDSLDGVKYTTNAYKEDGRTKNVESYYLDINQWPFVYNYEIKYHQGSVKINPKDVTLGYGGFEIVDSSIKVLEGTPTYESQLVNGDTTETAPKISYGTTGLGDGLSYGVDYYVNGEKISSGDTVGNYRFNYDDSTVIKLNNPENRRVQTLDMMKMAAALKGNADFDLDASKAAVEGVEKVAGLMDGQLPGFKVVGQNVVPCGVFEISTTPDAVKVTQKPATAGATAAEPERGANQYRELSKMLDTVDGAANFTLTYNGSRFQIYPDGKEAQALLAKGESEGNVNVAAAALLSAFKEMGLSLEDMDAVYVHMDKDSAALYN